MRFLTAIAMKNLFSFVLLWCILEMNRSKEVDVLKIAYRGTIGGNVIYLDETTGFSVGTHALVTLRTLSQATQKIYRAEPGKLIDCREGVIICPLRLFIPI